MRGPAIESWLAPDASRRERRDADDAIDAAIARIARSQDGVVARRQLLAAGIHPEAIDRRIASGALHVIHPGVYAVGQRALAPIARVRADLLRCGPGARAGGLTSAALHGAVTLERRARATIVVSPEAKPAPRGVRVRRLGLHPWEGSSVSGVPCLSPARTILDVSALHGAPTAERVWRGLVHRAALDMDAVAALLERHDGERGIVAVRDLYARRLEIIGASESGLESRVAQLAALAGIPDLARNERVVLSSGRVVRFDLCLPAERLAIEADGPYHDDPEVRADDAARDAEAAADGWRTERVHHAEPQEVTLARFRALARRLSVDLPRGSTG